MPLAACRAPALGRKLECLLPESRVAYLNIEHVGKDFPNREGGRQIVCVLDDVSLSIEKPKNR